MGVNDLMDLKGSFWGKKSGDRMMDKKEYDDKLKSDKRWCHLGRKGQSGLMLGLMSLILAVILFIMMMPILSTVTDIPRGCSYLNCVGYIDNGATTASCSADNQTYDPGLETKSLSCTAMDIFLPGLIISVLFGIISKLLSGKFGEEQQMYGGY